ncbi:MAG: GntR family transcriptional regulator [Nitrospirae bacterium]|nr:GntR family transcriptional regulator [Nitrospirota bacterium]
MLKIPNSRNFSNTVNKRSPIPAYNQLIDIIYSQIKDRVLLPDGMLPSETELCKMYGISRTTVREALRRLTRDGLLYTIKGKGTFVAEPKLDQIMIKIPNFYEDMAERGLKPDVKVLDIRVIEANKLVSEKLKVPLKEEVFRIKRLFLADSKPYVLEKKYIVCKDCKVLNSYNQEDLINIEDQSVFDVLAGKCHICNEYAHVSIEATTIREDEAKYLEAPVGTLAFYVDVVAYKKDDTPCGWIASIYRANLYRFKTRINNYALRE